MKPPTLEEKAPRRLSGTDTGRNQERPNNTTAATDGKRIFDPAALEDMRSRLPEYLTKLGVELRRQGARLVGRCPCHEDSNPSFAVFPNGTSCGCFPCGHSGDVFATSVWLGRASTFPEAVKDVAAVLGLCLPHDAGQATTRPTTAPQRPAKAPEPPFVLADADREKIHAARLAWTDAFHGGNPLVDRIAESLTIDRETLRYASWGQSGLGISNGWLCYCYPSGMKWRNPNPSGKPRFRWIVGKATQPWRMGWAAKPEVGTVYLTESESDCLALISAGIEADGTAACVASPGTSFPQSWAPMFIGKRVILCFDSDTAGQAAAAKVGAMLAPHAASVLTTKGFKP